MSTENDLTRVHDTVARAMSLLEQIPQGGIGEHGATRQEIKQAELSGHVVCDDAAYHVVQSAWLMLNEIRLHE
jgi:hypothetical protein